MVHRLWFRHQLVAIEPPWPGVRFPGVRFPWGSIPRGSIPGVRFQALPRPSLAGSRGRDAIGSPLLWRGGGGDSAGVCGIGAYDSTSGTSESRVRARVRARLCGLEKAGRIHPGACGVTPANAGHWIS